MNRRQRKELTAILDQNVQYECPMNRYTTFRVGGPAEALCMIRELDELKRTVAYLDGEKIPYLVVGRGSNLLVKDEGFRGVAVMLREDLARVETNGKNDHVILAGGGSSLFELIEYCKSKGLAGLEFLAGIPGTIGGAVAMNAGAWGSEIGPLVQEVQMVTPEGGVSSLEQSGLEFTYRALLFPKGAVIVKVKFELNPKSPEAVVAKVTDYIKKRQESQPSGYPSGGSVFKNPLNDFAGRLIERAGLKGKKIGGAMISPEHANFIVNTGGASASDILALMDLARIKVREQTGIELESEIRVVG